MAVDYTNKTLAKLMSLDFIAVIVVVAVAWGAMTVKVESLERRTEQDKAEAMAVELEMKRDAKELAGEVNSINRKLDVIGNNQDHFRQQVLGMGQSLEKIQAILEKH